MMIDFAINDDHGGIFFSFLTPIFSFLSYERHSRIYGRVFIQRKERKKQQHNQGESI
jgi:hypothetical protein